ncbi:MAG: hypothetical protein WC803_06300 [Sphingomonas sp.]|jgi:hypothetical protein
MKQANFRHRSLRQHHREAGVSTLSPPGPPSPAPRHEPEVARAVALPDADEPLAKAAFPSRQQRRQAKRVDAKRKIHKRQIPPRHTTAPAATPHELAHAIYPTAPVTGDAQSTTVAQNAPLPKNRALAPLGNQRLARLRAWLWPFAVKRRAREYSVAQHLSSLRDDVARLHASLEQAMARLGD